MNIEAQPPRPLASRLGREYKLTRRGSTHARTEARVMSSYRKNLMVGVTVLCAMLALACIVLKYGDKPASLFIEPRLVVQFTADRADGIADGSAVLYRGVNVGRVAKVSRGDDQIHVIM